LVRVIDRHSGLEKSRRHQRRCRSPHRRLPEQVVRSQPQGPLRLLPDNHPQPGLLKDRCAPPRPRPASASRWRRGQRAPPAAGGLPRLARWLALAPAPLRPPRPKLRQCVARGLVQAGGVDRHARYGRQGPRLPAGRRQAKRVRAVRVPAVEAHVGPGEHVPAAERMIREQIRDLT
jgi:hypothetical protein